MRCGWVAFGSTADPAHTGGQEHGEHHRGFWRHLAGLVPGLAPASRARRRLRGSQARRGGTGLRKALGIADTGYVLVQGRNAYTDTGAALLANPEVRRTFLGG